jgi:hypothetical protein
MGTCLVGPGLYKCDIMRHCWVFGVLDSDCMNWEARRAWMWIIGFYYLHGAERGHMRLTIGANMGCRTAISHDWQAAGEVMMGPRRIYP